MCYSLLRATFQAAVILRYVPSDPRFKHEKKITSDYYYVSGLSLFYYFIYDV